MRRALAILILAAALYGTGHTAPCQPEYGHNPGQLPHWSLICE